MPSVHLTLEQFTGPLDLLLSLIAEEKLSVTEISLSRITEQYLQHVESLDEKQPEEIADFLVVATRLLLLKSRLLLPQFAPEEEDGPSLEAQLRLYKAFVDASRKVNRLWLSPARSAWRVEPPRKAESFVSPTNVGLATLHKSMVQLVNRLRPPKAIPATTIDGRVSLKDKIDRIRTLLSQVERIGFHEIVGSARNKTDIIISFLAILELVKQQSIALVQEDTFSDIEIIAVKK